MKMDEMQLALPGLEEPLLPEPPQDYKAARKLLWALNAAEYEMTTATLAQACSLTVPAAASELSWLRSRSLIQSRTALLYNKRQEVWKIKELGRHAVELPVLGQRATSIAALLSEEQLSTSELVACTQTSADVVCYGLRDLKEVGLVRKRGRRRTDKGGNEQIWELTEEGHSVVDILPYALSVAPLKRSQP